MNRPGRIISLEGSFLGFFKSVANAVSSVAQAVAAPVVAPVAAVVNIAKGGDVGSSIAGAIVPSVPGVENAKLAQDLTGGKADDLVSKIPILGGSGSNYINSGEALANGDITSRNVKIFGTESAKFGALALAGSGAAGAISAPTALLGAKVLSSNDPGRALASIIDQATGLPVSGFLPNPISPGGQKVTPIGDYLDNPSIPDVTGLKKSSFNPAAIAVIGAVVLGAYYFARK